MKLIGITGPSHVGKSTLAKAIIAANGGGVRMSFAAPIYRGLAAMYDVTVDYIQEHKRERIPGTTITWRRALETLGTEWGRLCVSYDIWVSIAERDALEKLGRPLIVVDDVRFENEALMIHRHGGTIIEAQRGGVEYPRDHDTAQRLPDECIDSLLILPPTDTEEYQAQVQRVLEAV